MQRRFVLGLSAVLALLAFALLQVWKLGVTRQFGAGGEPVSIVVAVRDLPVGQTLVAADLATMDWPRRWLPPRHVAGGLTEALVGQRLGATVPAGQPVLHTDLAAERLTETLSQRIPASLRGLALGVDAISTFDGLLQPGDRVDIVVTWTGPDRTVETRTLLQNVAVAAVGATMADGPAAGTSGRKSARSGTVTVVVNAKEAEMLIFAEKQGELSLTLHRDQDVSVAEGLTRTTWFDEAAVRTLQQDRQARPKDCVSILKANRKTELICG